MDTNIYNKAFLKTKEQNLLEKLSQIKMQGHNNPIKSPRDDQSLALENHPLYKKLLLQNMSIKQNISDYNLAYYKATSGIFEKQQEMDMFSSYKESSSIRIKGELNGGMFGSIVPQKRAVAQIKTGSKISPNH